MAVTYLDLQNRINLDYLNRTDLQAETKRAIQASIRYYEGRRWHWNETSTNLASVASQAFVNVPADFMVLDLLQITAFGGTYKLVERDFEFIKNQNVTSFTGVPSSFAIRQQRFNLSPIPDSAYTIPCHYLQKLTALSADTDTNKWLSAAEDVIAYHATKIMYATVVRSQPDNVMLFQQLENEALGKLFAANEQRMHHAIKATRF